MAPKQQQRVHKISFWGKIRKVLDPKYLSSFLLDANKLPPTAGALLIFELIVNIFIINRVRYTEIDWKAYMQEVAGPLNGTFNYAELKGDTGPLVYPAGFVWIFMVLYSITSYGENIRLAQYIFLVFHLVTLALVFRIYIKAKKVPPYVLVLTCVTSYRIHSIYVLRLFNDPVAMLLLFASLNAFLDYNWTLGSMLYSLAVSVKMNILLFAPALLLAYLTNLGLTNTIKQLIICGLIQFILAAPFLVANPIAYILGAFDFGRVFLYKWTVNWRFLPESFFLHRSFHIGLLIVHLSLLALFYSYSKLTLRSYSRLKAIEADLKPQLKANSPFNMSSSSQLLLTPLFVANFIGIVCSRSLHYQFYVWYFHTLPYLVWCTNYSIRIRLIILGVIEFCWNTYPSTTISSLALLICHIMLLFGIYRTQSSILAVKNNK